MMTGRQILLMIYDHFRVTEVDNNILDVEDLIAVKMVGDDLRFFLRRVGDDSHWHS